MAQINLLYPEVKKVESKQIAATSKFQSKKAESPLLPLSVNYSMILLRCVIAFGVCALIWGFVFLDVIKKEKRLKECQAKIEKIEITPKQMDKLRSERLGLEKKISLIEELSVRKFYWYEKLEQIAYLIPNGVWLTEISSNQQRITQKNSSGKKGAPSEDIIKTTLTIKGMAVAYKIDDAIGLIGDFIKNLQKSADVSTDFADIKLNAIGKSIIGGLDVMQFDIRCESK